MATLGACSDEALMLLDDAAGVAEHGVDRGNFAW